MSKTWVLAFTLATGVFLATDARAACTISTSGVSFGTYSVFDVSPVDSTGSITFRCQGSDSNLSISLSPGQGGTFFPRAMSNSGEILPYNLFQDAARSSVWGDGSAGTGLYISVWNPGPRITVTIYGRIPAGADVTAGNYTDTVVATINF